jgi:hypothetical protein
VSLFWENATQLLEAAVASGGVGFPTTDSMTVLIGSEGGIHILANNDWPLGRIAEERGAQRAYRVTRANGRVSVNGTDGTSTCRLETESPDSKLKQLLRDQPRYLLS